MKVKIKEQISLCKYKGHYIRKVVDEFYNELVFIDKAGAYYENAPAFMKDEDFHYASVADAKRAINGEPTKWVSVDVKDYRFESYKVRFNKEWRVMREIMFQGNKFTLSQCEDIWQWFATSKVFEFTYFYDRVVFHAPNDYFYGAYKDNLDNFVRI